MDVWKEVVGRVLTNELSKRAPVRGTAFVAGAHPGRRSCACRDRRGLSPEARPRAEAEAGSRFSPNHHQILVAGGQRRRSSGIRAEADSLSRLRAEARFPGW